MRAVANTIVSGSTSSSLPRRRSYIFQDRIEANDRLMKDYFNDTPTFNDAMFQRRYRMSKRLFLCIVGDLEREYTYFQQKPDARGYLGFTAIQKCTSALCIHEYGNTTDMNDEYLKMAEKTTRDSLENFCIGIIQLYAGCYLQIPTLKDLTCIYDVHEIKHFFPGMIGNIDCMHWEWSNCPTIWQEQRIQNVHELTSTEIHNQLNADLVHHVGDNRPIKVEDEDEYGDEYRDEEENEDDEENEDEEEDEDNE
ncbi:uncharacterized protein LOC143583162 [Bidens hawaiensis]|uniref:uncharacterized protein LOC143583162 n=1 Tax=Bidens hawaiensis TaxID=980011 RepID=UPI00404B480C